MPNRAQLDRARLTVEGRLLGARGVHGLKTGPGVDSWPGSRGHLEYLYNGLLAPEHCSDGPSTRP